MLPPRAAVALLALTGCLIGGRAAPTAAVAARRELPVRLTDAEFWGLIDAFSEPNGFFRSDNLVSNEDTFQYAIPELVKRVRPGSVYLGVGPDQNFTYIVALRPRMAFITDIRRGNLQEHLMCKALIELSADRAEFLSRLFSRARPAGLWSSSTPEQLFGAYQAIAPSQALCDQNLAAIIERLSRQRGSRLSDEDVSGITYIYGSFFTAGPSLSYSSAPSYGRVPRHPTYEDLQLADDGMGRHRGYLASEENFQALKAFESTNRLVPLVGNFAGPKALRAVAAYVKDHDARVGAFYTSNVEQYLFGDGLWGDFARNVAELPLEESSTFIRSCFVSCVSPAGSRSVTLLDTMIGLLRDFSAGKVQTYWDVLSHSR